MSRSIESRSSTTQVQSSYRRSSGARSGRSENRATGTRPVSELPPSMRADRYDRTAESRSAGKTAQASGADRPRARLSPKQEGKLLARLDEQGILDQKDKNGVSVREHLRELDRQIEAQGRGENVRIPEAFRPAGGRGQDRGDSLQALKSQILRDLAEPCKIRQSSGTLTCGPATAQAALARTSPGEYVRMATDLAIKGQTETAGKSILKLDRRGFDNTRDGRSMTEDMFQPAMAALARRKWPAGQEEGSFGGGSYGPTRMFGGGRYGRSSTRFGGGGSGDDALTSAQYAGLMASMIQGNQSSVDIQRDSQRRSLNRQVAAALASGPVAVGLASDGRGGPGGHAVQVVDMSAKVGRSGQLEVTYHDPLAGEVRMPAKQFFAKVVHVTLPGPLGRELGRS